MNIWYKIQFIPTCYFESKVWKIYNLFLEDNFGNKLAMVFGTKMYYWPFHFTTDKEFIKTKYIQAHFPGKHNQHNLNYPPPKCF